MIDNGKREWGTANGVMREGEERECEINFRDRDWENAREKKGKRERKWSKEQNNKWEKKGERMREGEPRRVKERKMMTWNVDP